MSGRKNFSKELRGRERIATFPPHDLHVKGRDISKRRTFWHSENVKKERRSASIGAFAPIRPPFDALGRVSHIISFEHEEKLKTPRH